MDAVDVAVTLVAGSLVVLIGVEFVAPARAFEHVPGWRRKCVAFMPMIILISTTVPWLLEDVVADVALLPGHELGLVGGTAVGILASELLVYWVHRLHHRLGFLWRFVHQIHHSAERMDVFGAAYFHPLEILEGSVVGVVFFGVVLGLSPEAAALSMIWQAFAGVFQHGNINTPVWLGYFIQRPEQHCVHHERGVHGFNYANLPLWDMIFGTFRNPRRWEGLAGFYSGSSRPTVAMLLGRDISDEQWRVSA